MGLRDRGDFGLRNLGTLGLCGGAEEEVAADEGEEDVGGPGGEGGGEIVDVAHGFEECR